VTLGYKTLKYQHLKVTEKTDEFVVKGKQNKVLEHQILSSIYW
jgi:hypothetical protein